MITEPRWILRRAPGFSDEAIDVSTQHRAGMVHNEKWIELHFFQLTLTCDASALAFEGEMLRQGQVGRNESGIPLMFVGLYDHFR